MQPDVVVMDNLSTLYFAKFTNENLQAAFAVGSKNVQALGKISDSPSATQAESNRKAEVNPESAFPVERAGVGRGQSATCNYSEGPLCATYSRDNVMCCYTSQR